MVGSEPKALDSSFAALGRDGFSILIIGDEYGRKAEASRVKFDIHI
jgi:hypothetical protein